MGKRDIADREFFADRGRFAELVNISIYQGRGLVIPEDLTQLKGRYPSLAGNAGEKERDILMKDKRRNVYYGVEIETESDYSMPERVMVYDACEYEQQIKVIHNAHKDKKDYKKYREWKSRMLEKDFLFPVITIVLFLGEGRWKGRQKLLQMFHLPEEIRSWMKTNIQNYNFILMEADYENPASYQTDLKEFFRAMQCRRDKEQLRRLFQTEEFRYLKPETEWTIAVHLHIKGLMQKMKEEIPMCKAFDDLTKEWKQEGKIEGIKEGIKEGKAKGRKEEKIQIIRRMVKEGLDEALISRTTGCTKKEFAEALEN